MIAVLPLRLSVLILVLKLDAGILVLASKLNKILVFPDLLETL